MIGRNSEAKRHIEAEIAKYQCAIGVNPENSSAHAMLGETYYKAGRYDEAIHEFRTAINLSPHGPHSTKWKSNLRKALELQAGAKPYDFAVCDRCRADVPTDARACPRCGTRLRMGFVEWLLQPEVLKDVGRQTAVATSIAIILLVVFSSLSLEWKACVMCATVIVGGYYALRGIGG
ncbi:MAG: hypothetical protein JWN98_2435 [Abditibacteriota bacterium]|nr:hypothetical protein [Abditibacteriota bacterium]